MTESDFTVDDLRLLASILRDAARERDREPGHEAMDLRHLAGKAERLANQQVWQALPKSAA